MVAGEGIAQGVQIPCPHPGHDKGGDIVQQFGGQPSRFGHRGKVGGAVTLDGAFVVG